MKKIKKFFSPKNLKKLLDDDKTGFGNFYFDLFLIILILISSLLFVMETYFTQGKFSLFLKSMDYLIMSIFTLEVFLRNYFAKNRKKVFFSIYNLIDLLAIIPFWFINNISLQYLRVFRILKLFKFLNKYFNSHYLSKKRNNQIIFLKVFSTLFILIFISSSLIFSFESPHNDKINTFADAIYLSLVTVTTVGFGDIVPATEQGRFIIMIIILFGIFLIPVYISSLLRNYISSAYKKNTICKNCGLARHDYNATHCKMCGNLIFQKYQDEV